MYKAKKTIKYAVSNYKNTVLSLVEGETVDCSSLNMENIERLLKLNLIEKAEEKKPQKPKAEKPKAKKKPKSEENKALEVENKEDK